MCKLITVPPIEKQPIFIIGAAPRSGTNFLFRLLELHPDCEPGMVFSHRDGTSLSSEDLFLYKAGHLDLYATKLSNIWKNWRPDWEINNFHARELLLAGIGRGLLSLLQLRIEDEGHKFISPNKRLITKSPHPQNLNLFLDLFPQSKLILIIRDGRSVVESSIQTFGWSLSRGARLWRRGSEIFNNFTSKNPGSHFLIRYEDLVTNTKDCLQSIFGYADLSLDVYDFSQLSSFPVIGSSVHKDRRTNELDWEGSPRGDKFDPNYRFRNWSIDQHQTFNFIAGQHLTKWGYQVEHDKQLSAASYTRLALQEKFASIAWSLRNIKILRYILNNINLLNTFVRRYV